MKKLYLFLAVMTVFALAITACAPATPVATEAPTAVPPGRPPPSAGRPAAPRSRQRMGQETFLTISSGGVYDAARWA